MKIEKEQEMYDLATNYMSLYGVNVNMARAIPFIKDGLKPIHRRILYAAYRFYRDNFVKTSVLLGDVGKFSPHGDQGLNAVVAKMAQPFANNIPLLTAKGNVGNVTTGNDFAADRYYAVKISKFAMDMIFGEFDGKVNMIPSYDGSLEEPFTLPTKFPIILLNGTSGIGYTLSSDIPPYNLIEVANATIKIIEFFKEFKDASEKYCRKHKNYISEYLSFGPNVYNVMTIDPKVIKELGLKRPKIHLVPDSPTGCNIYIKDANKFLMESVYTIDNTNYTITIKNTPYLKFLDNIDAALREVQRSNNPINEIIDAGEQSDDVSKEFKYVIKCKPCNVQNVVNTLFRRVGGFRSTLSTSNMTVIDSTYHTKNFTVGEILGDWIAQRFVDKRAWFLRDLVEKTTRLNMLEGVEIMLRGKNLEKTINIIKKNKRHDVVPALVKGYNGEITSSQAAYVNELPLYRITVDEHDKTVEEIEKLNDKIKWIRKVTDNDDAVLDTIVDDLTQVKTDYPIPRKSRIISGGLDETLQPVGTACILPSGNILLSEMASPELISSDIKTLSGSIACLIDEYGSFINIDTRTAQHNAELPLQSLGNDKKKLYKCVGILSNPNNYAVILTNKSRVKIMPIKSILTSKANIVPRSIAPLDTDETIVSVLEVSNLADDALVYTKDGLGKRIRLSDVVLSTTTSAIGRFLNQDINNVSGMFIIDGNKPLILYVSNLGRLRVNHAKYLVAGKKYSDLKPIIELSERDDLIAVFCCDDKQTVTLHLDNGKLLNVKIDTLGISTINTPPVKAKGLTGRTTVIRASIT